MAITMVGCSAPYCEAIDQRLTERALPQATGDDHPRIVLVQCDDEERWARLDSEIAAPDTVAVAVLPSLTLDLYVRALAAGAAGAVYVDTTSAITADVIEAALNGEVLLPQQAAQNLAMLAKRLQPPTNLDEAETRLLRAIASGQTIVDLARETYFSERTVRRHLQSLYLKLGVQNRAEAIAAATRMGVVD